MEPTDYVSSSRTTAIFSLMKAHGSRTSTMERGLNSSFQHPNLKFNSFSDGPKAHGKTENSRERDAFGNTITQPNNGKSSTKGNFSTGTNTEKVLRFSMETDMKGLSRWDADTV
jgi:hypothetical protein